MTQIQKPKTKHSSPPKVLSVFSGAGGLDLGLEAAGLHTIACVEQDIDARETLIANRPNWNLLENPDAVRLARHLIPRDLNLNPGDLDLIAGGPPCQPFSTAAQWSPRGRQGMGDGRADTVHAFLNLVESFLPRAILIENVSGFLSGANSALPVIERRLSEINSRNHTKYGIQWTILDAALYGVPQHRRRAIAVAFRSGSTWIPPKETHVNNPMTAWDALWNIPPSNDFPVTAGKWANLLPSVPEGQNYQWFTSKGGGPEIFGYRTRYWNFLLKLAKDLPSWTISASPGPSAGPFHWNNRPLSVQERLAIQSFPPEWTMSGSLRSRIKMTGNATPPLLAEVLGIALAEHLGFSTETGKNPKFLQERAPVPPTKEIVQHVPKEYLKMVGPRDSHPGVGRGPGSRRNTEPEA